MSEEIDITVRSKGITYTFTSEADIKRALDDQWQEGYDEGYSDAVDEADFHSTSQFIFPGEVIALIEDRIFQIKNGTTHADKSTVKVLEELIEEI